MKVRLRLSMQGLALILILIPIGTLTSARPDMRASMSGKSTGEDAEFAPGELIVKFRDGVEPHACAALRALEARHAGTRSERVFPHLLDRADINRRNPTRAMRARGAARRPDLGRTYKITLGSPSADVLEAVRDLRQDPGVEYAEPNFIMRASVEVNDPFYSSAGSWGQPYDDLWGVKIIRADLAWSQADGLGVVVAVSDTGLDYTHEDIRNRVWVNPGEDLNGNGLVDATDFNGADNDQNGFIDDVRGWDFHNVDNDPLEDHYHGTHVAGTIAAEGNNGLGIIGVAHRARIMPLKFLNFQGFGTSEDGAASIIYAAENGADVINMSWGGSSSGRQRQHRRGGLLPGRASRGHGGRIDRPQRRQIGFLQLGDDDRRGGPRR